MQNMNGMKIQGSSRNSSLNLGSQCHSQRIFQIIQVSVKTTTFRPRSDNAQGRENGDANHDQNVCMKQRSQHFSFLLEFQQCVIPQQPDFQFLYGNITTLVSSLKKKKKKNNCEANISLFFFCKPCKFR